jgi:hypothetical protein
MGKCKRKAKQLRMAEVMHEGLEASTEDRKPAKDIRQKKKKNPRKTTMSLAGEV